MVERWKLKEGERVFINGASGSVGVLAVQLARSIVGKNVFCLSILNFILYQFFKFYFVILFYWIEV